MIPSASDIFALARFHLGDTKVPGGQLFQDNFLSNFWPDTYSTLYRYLDKNANKLIRASQYFNLPANTGYVTPAGLGLANMGKPLEIRDRAVGVKWIGTVRVIQPTTPGNIPFVDIETSDVHDLSSGAEVITFGFTDVTGINGSWYITVLNSFTVRLMGAEAIDPGSGIGSLGRICTGSGQFSASPLQQVWDLDALPLSSSNGQLSQWTWKNGAFMFVPANAERQIKITFDLSGAPPSDPSTPIGIDDSLTPLSLFIAASAAAAKGFLPKSQALFMRAVGNTSGDETNISGGAFYSLAQIGLQAVQQTRIVMPRYRARRNIGPYPVGNLVR